MSEITVKRGKEILSEKLKNQLIVLDQTGDTKLIWNGENSSEVTAARNLFDELKGKGFLAYSVEDDGENGEQIREFDPEAEKIIMTPPMQGG